MSAYGLDLRKSLWGESPLGVRRLLSLMKGLPKDSALQRAAGNDWTQEDELLASIVDVLNVSNHLFLKANTKAGTTIPEPGYYPRPWENPDGTSRTLSSPDEARAFFVNPEFGDSIWDAHGKDLIDGD